MRRLALWAALGLPIVLSAVSAPAFAAGRNLTGSPAPEIQVDQGLYGLSSGTTLSSMRGKVVVVKFFFTSCPACRASLPAFDSLNRRYSPMGVQFMAVAYDSRSNVESYWSRNGFSIPVAIDPSGVSASRYGVSSFPTNYIIGADGYVKAYDNLSSSIIDRELAAANAGGSIPTPSAPATSTAPVAPQPPAAGMGERNVAELGTLPAALAGAKDAAAQNDYGAVLRVAEAHLDPAKDSADVVAAAQRVQTLARGHYQRRVDRIESRWRGGDQVGAYLALLRMVEDFRGTEYERPLILRSQRVYKLLTGEPAVASRPAPASH